MYLFIAKCLFLSIKWGKSQKMSDDFVSDIFQKKKWCHTQCRRRSFINCWRNTAEVILIQLRIWRYWCGAMCGNHFPRGFGEGQEETHRCFWRSTWAPRVCSSTFSSVDSKLYKIIDKFIDITPVTDNIQG